MAGLCEIIERRVEQGFKLQPRDLRINSRARRIARPRQVAMYLIRVHTPMSFPQIGNYFQGRDHTTSLYACRRVVKLMQEDSEFAAKVESIRQSLVGVIPIHEGLAAVTIAEGLKSFPFSVFDLNFGPFIVPIAPLPPSRAMEDLRHSGAESASHAAFYSEVRQSPPSPLASKGVQIGQPVPPTSAAYLDTHKFSGART